jgi:hypothetical protein
VELSDPDLARALAAWASSPEVEERACAHNLMFEERVSERRQAAFEAARPAGVFSSPGDLQDLQVAYYKDTIQYAPGAPEPFTEVNEAASFAELSPETVLVRLECLNPALEVLRIPSADFVDAFSHSDASSRALVNKFVLEWNTNPLIVEKRNRLSFAAIRDSVLVELAAPDWAHKLRDRFGLAHYDPKYFGPIVVALMTYTAGEVRNMVQDDVRFVRTFSVPTALDGTPYSQFFPTPAEFDCGCPMALSPIATEDDLIAEVLHPRMVYRRKHLTKVTLLDDSAAPADLQELRNNHLVALQLAAYTAGRDRDFGMEI